MKNRYFKLFEELQQNEVANNPNDRILVIDGTNQFIRAHCASPVVSDSGYHMGGLTGFLMSVGYAIKNIKPTRIIYCFDGKGGSQKRRKLFSEYKEHRRARTNPMNPMMYKSMDEEDKSMQHQLFSLIKILDALPVQYMAIDNIEADDAIAYIVEYYKQKYSPVFYIMSTDKDYLQLVDDKITIWSPTKKKFYTKETVMEEYGVPSKNLIYARALMGDPSDGIPGIPGWGLKTIHKRLPILSSETEEISCDVILNYITDKQKTAKVYQVLYENFDKMKLNYELMQLQGVDISGTSKEKIRNIIDAPIPRLSKHIFIQLLVENGLNQVIKNPEMWLKELYWKLDVFAGMTH